MICPICILTLLNLSIDACPECGLTVEEIEQAWARES